MVHKINKYSQKRKFYVNRIKDLIKTVFPGIGYAIFTRDYFLRGLLNEVSYKIRARKLSTIEDCIRRADICKAEGCNIIKKRKIESLNVIQGTQYNR